MRPYLAFGKVGKIVIESLQRYLVSAVPAFLIQFCREAPQSLMVTRRTPKSEKRLGRHPVQSDFKDNAVSISEGKLQQKEYEICGLVGKKKTIPIPPQHTRLS